MLLEIGIFILSIAFLLLALFSIPSLLQLRKTPFANFSRPPRVGEQGAAYRH